ncbi:MAG: hypothetical protein KF726_21360 [Anaerolineae bacterium]|nr:hypothetical protein [Anaerolineae bacterium]
MRKTLLLVVLLLAISVAMPIRPARAQSGGLSGLLGQVADTPAARTVIWYGSLGDLASVLKINVGTLNDVNALDTTVQRTYLLETGAQIYFSGYSGLADAAGWQQKYGINSFAISRELTVGTGKDRYGILQGAFDANAINGALGALGYQSSSAAGATIFVSPDANAPLPAVAVKSDGLLVAQADQIATLLAPATVIGGDAAYAAVASVLESGSTTPGSLISAVIYDGGYLTNTVFADLAGRISAVRSQIGLDTALPPFTTAGIGYRFDGNQRYWVIALAYSDGGAAGQAAGVLQQRLGLYTSLQAPGAPLFQGWATQVTTQQASGVSVVVAVMNAQADIPWAQTMADRDVAFLAN